MAKSTTPKKAPAKRSGRKNEQVIALLRRQGGATLAEITEATGWLPHSARAVLTGFRKKGLTIEKSKADGTTRWSITSEPTE